MNVNEIDGAASGDPVRSVASVKPVSGVIDSQPTEPVDEVLISSVNELLADITATSEVRAERLARIKSAIDDGTYETTDKMEAALERLLDEIGGVDSGR